MAVVSGIVRAPIQVAFDFLTDLDNFRKLIGRGDVVTEESEGQIKAGHVIKLRFGKDPTAPVELVTVLDYRESSSVRAREQVRQHVRHSFQCRL